MEQIYYLIFLACVEIVGDFSLERYANTREWESLVLGSGSYIGVVYLLIQSLKGSTILYVNGMWDGLSCIVESLMAYLVLGERLQNQQYLGLGLTIAGLFLLRKVGG